MIFLHKSRVHPAINDLVKIFGDLEMLTRLRKRVIWTVPLSIIVSVENTEIFLNASCTPATPRHAKNFNSITNIEKIVRKVVG